MNAIPGYNEAVTAERKARNVIYLGAGEVLCGIRVENVTPHTLAILNEAESPFLFGGEYDHRHAAQFIAALQDADKRDMASVLETLLPLEIEDIADEIAEFVSLTFLDAPTGGGGEEAPIASGIAWLEYRMACEPFRWPCEKTLRTPLRRIYQLIRCWQKEQGDIVINSRSGRCESDWLDMVNAGLKDGSITPGMIEEMQAAAVRRKAGAHLDAPAGPTMPADTEARGREMK